MSKERIKFEINDSSISSAPFVVYGEAGSQGEPRTNRDRPNQSDHKQRFEDTLRRATKSKK